MASALQQIADNLAEITAATAENTAATEAARDAVDRHTKAETDLHAEISRMMGKIDLLIEQRQADDTARREAWAAFVKWGDKCLDVAVRALEHAGSRVSDSKLPLLASHALNFAATSGAWGTVVYALHHYGVI